MDRDQIDARIVSLQSAWAECKTELAQIEGRLEECHFWLGQLTAGETQVSPAVSKPQEGE